ncbi:hypothetical protein B0H17DRAFT_953697 [Mycena rosella]|uniref:Uncharacterized protein n=1 Tax=Mycena rosella TaxID=1033263 RepID=A0AAD7G5F5_MYCRO|nr:hypothetical protein B0H17DRAFT_953697 [Mycena rosella]
MPSVIAAVNFSQCLEEVRSGQWGTTGGLDNYGHPLSNISEATAITYDLCLTACGSGSEAFDWNIFSQQFTAWLLPYLALVSQLPFGAKTRLENLVSMFLTVGSPTLAAYSVALTVLNGHWIAERFAHLNYPNIRNAVRILSSLQQSSLQIDTENSLLASLIILPENDEWWLELALWLNYVHTWSISAVASILWVVIAYLFTVVDSFTGVLNYSTLNANGQAVGSVFLWLLPIVVAWLQISPKCDFLRVHQAIRRANAIAYVATPNGQPTLASSLSSKRAISIRHGAGEIHCDEQCTAPIFNYARFLPWTLAVEDVYYAFREASFKSERNQPVNSQAAWETGDKAVRVRPANRRGSLPQVVAYAEPGFKCFEPDLPNGRPRARWGSGVVSRFFVASVLALGLTWGTIGAALIVSYFTPAKGIGCRAGSYLIYGVLSTVIWIMLVASSLLAHYSTSTATFNGRYLHTKSTRLAGIISIILRRTGKTLATINTVWIMLACLFQFSSFFDRCYCNSSIFTLGKNAYNVIDILPKDVAALNAPWIGGVALAGGCAILFLAFVNVLIDPALPD